MQNIGGLGIFITQNKSEQRWDCLAYTSHWKIWWRAHTFVDVGPIALLKSLMKDHKMKAVDLAKLLNVSEGLVSDILNYKKGLSKETIRILSERFKLNQEAFNRPYKLKVPVTPKVRNARLMNTRKDLATAWGHLLKATNNIQHRKSKIGIRIIPARLCHSGGCCFTCS